MRSALRLFDDSLGHLNSSVRDGFALTIAAAPLMADDEPLRRAPLMCARWVPCKEALPLALSTSSDDDLARALDAPDLLRFDSAYRMLDPAGAGVAEPRGCAMSLRTLGLLLARSRDDDTPPEFLAQLGGGQLFQWDNNDLLCVLDDRPFEASAARDRRVRPYLLAFCNWLSAAGLPSLSYAFVVGLNPATAHTIMTVEAAKVLLDRMPPADLVHCSHTVQRVVMTHMDTAINKFVGRLPPTANAGVINSAARRIAAAYVRMRYVDALILNDGLRAVAAYLTSHEPVAYGIAQFQVPVFPVEAEIAAAERSEAVRADDMAPRPIVDRDDAHRARAASYLVVCFCYTPMAQSGTVALQRLADGQPVDADALAKAACAALAWKWVYFAHLVPLYCAPGVAGKTVMQTCSLAPFTTLPQQARWHQDEPPLSARAAYRRYAFRHQSALGMDTLAGVKRRIVRMGLQLPFASRAYTPAMPAELVVYYPVAMAAPVVEQMAGSDVEDDEGEGRVRAANQPLQEDDGDDVARDMAAWRKRRAGELGATDRQLATPWGAVRQQQHIAEAMCARDSQLHKHVTRWPMHRQKEGKRGLGSLECRDWYTANQQRLATVPVLAVVPYVPPAPLPPRRGRIFACELRTEDEIALNRDQLFYLVPDSFVTVTVSTEAIDELVSLVLRHYVFSEEPPGKTRDPAAPLLLSLHHVLAVHVYWRNMCQDAGAGINLVPTVLSELARVAARKLPAKTAANARYAVRRDSPYWLVVRRLSARISHTVWYARMVQEGPFVHHRPEPLLNT